MILVNNNLREEWNSQSKVIFSAEQLEQVRYEPKIFGFVHYSVVFHLGFYVQRKNLNFSK